MSTKAKKLVALLVTACMMMSLVPLSAFAAYDYAHNESASSDGYYNIISKNDWDIAPGIKETEIVLNNNAGDRRQVIHLMEADITNPYTRVISSYTNMDTSNYAISTIPEHAAYLENVWGENVVGAMNTCLSWYNTPTYAQDPSRVNEPLGFMMVDGEVYFDHSVGFPTCIIIHKDVNENGETRPASIPKVEMRTINTAADLNGWEEQVIPSSSGYIVKDGVNQSKPSHGTDTAARSVVGVKADGTVVIMMNDGRMAPYSLGMNMYECAEVMIAAGCVYASNCDGGGSSTFMSQRPGRDLEVNCTPCDGSLRQNTHGIMIISTAPATGEFSSAYLSTENDYYVPYSKVTVDAIGLDFSGAQAEIPAESTLTLKDASFGTIENGVFTSNGKTGEVTVEMMYNDSVVGSKTFNIVNPEVVTFSQSSTVIPYGKSIVLDIKATYGEFDVVYTADDFTWSISDETAGTRNGLEFVATNDTSKTKVTVSAKYKHADKGTTKLEISFGKGSEILYNFEDGDISDWLGKDAMVEWAKENTPNSPVLDKQPFGNNFSPSTDSTVFLATAENGKVKNGEYALGVELDYTYSAAHGQWAYNMFFNIGGQTVLRDTANGMNATRLGMWIYIPEELAPGHNLAMQAELYCGSSSTNYARKNTHLVLSTNGKTLTGSTEADIPEDRWVYCYMDLTPYNYVAIQNPYEYTSDRREPQFIRFYTKATEPFKGVLYFDDITLDYSDAVDDRNAPNITELTVNVSGTTMRSFNAKVADFAANNTSGLNYASAKIYVDGVALNGVTASGTTMSAPDASFTPGTHTVTFEIADNMGNVKKQSTTFKVEGTAPVTFSGHNDGNNVPEYDSVYYADINVEDITKIDTVTVDVQLNHANTWELDHMIAAAGFEASYTFNQYHNIASITVKKVGTPDASATTLVSIPVRVWSHNEEASGTAISGFEANSYPLVLVKAEVVAGDIAFADGSKGTFGGSINVATKMTTSVLPSAWHSHTVEAVADKAATCTEDGYTGRTYCAGCASVIDWGTTVAASGHTYTVVGNELVCSCGDKYTVNGLTDMNGNLYYILGGKLVSGWNYVDTANEATTGYYYFGSDYAAVDGVLTIDGYEYTFVDNLLVRGTLVESNGVVQYMWAGKWMTNTWTTIDGYQYYFSSKSAKTGPSTIRGESGTFAFDEKGRLMEGVGIMNIYGRLYYYENGKCKAAGLVKIGDDYYYINANFQPVTGLCWVGKPNTAVTGMTEGEYEFGEDGKMIRKIVKNGPVDGKFYIDGVQQTAYKMVEWEGNFYFIGDGNKLAANTTLYLAEKFTSMVGLPEGNYTFDADGKVVIKNGPVDGRFYIDGVQQKAYQLVEWDGNYYFISDSNKLAMNTTLYLSAKFVAGTKFTEGYYTFDADGKIVIKNGIVDGKYYIDGVLQKAYRMVMIDGDYYFISDSHKLAVNTTLYLGEKFTSMVGLPEGYYTFDSTGKMVVKDGIVDGKYYINGVLQKAYQVVEIDGGYYFISDSHKLAKNCTLYLSEKFTSMVGLPEGNYTFDENGKMVIKNGIVDGKYYINNVLQKAYQIVEIDGGYYFISDSNKLAKNTTLYLSEKFTSKIGLAAGNYTFDENGKMILKNGIVGDAFYINNVMQKAYQVVEWEGSYYFIGDGNKIVKNRSMYILDRYLVKYGFPADTYTFDAEGKMILKNGPVGNKFFINHVQQNAYQLLEWEGDFYFVSDGNLLARNTTLYLGTQYVYGTGLSAGYYTFDSTGKMILN